MKKRTLNNIICAVVAVCVLGYLLHTVFKTNYTAYDTETVMDAFEQSTLDLTGFIVRDEQYISGETSGTLVPLVSDGNRVASGDSVARVCKSNEDAADYAALINAKKDMERYEALNKETELNALDMEKLNNDIKNCYTDLLATIVAGDFSQLDDRISKYEDKLASKQILSSGAIDLSSKLSELESKIGTLEAKNIQTTNVLAPLSGYYISNLDGYENTISYSDVLNLTASQVESAINSEPENTDSKMGKIVGSYKWYIVAVADSKYVKSLPENRLVKFNMPYYGYDDIIAEIESVSEIQNGKIVVILSCNLMNENYANMRKIDFSIILKEYKGLKVNSYALHKDIDSNGKEVAVVYILRGNIMNTRKVEIIYDAGDYVIVSDSTKAGNGFKPVSRYDEVIVKGRNLSDGKSIS